MTLIAVMAIMVIFAVMLLAVAPTVHQEVQREKELEAIRRGEEIAEAIRQYVTFHNGTKLPESMDDLLDGLPQGTKKRMILRPSAATDPLSEDGRWRLIKADKETIAPFAKRVQSYNNGLLPSNPAPNQFFDKYSIAFLVNLDTGSEDDDLGADSFDVTTDNQPFIGVASQSRNKSILTYYGIERHSNWIFTPLFRGSSIIITGGTRLPGQPDGAPPPPGPRPPLSGPIQR
jgi:type II secretory pathway pseudopilin PulG